jgi:hypothetical protein
MAKNGGFDVVEYIYGLCSLQAATTQDTAILYFRIPLSIAEMPDLTVFITGSTGFIGSHVANAALAAGYRVRLGIRKYE